MSICITLAGEALIASMQAQGLPLVIDTMIFANVPGLDPAQAADRAQAVPTEHVVHSADIPAEYRAFVNPNQVVYSVLLGSDVGDFAFNWQGLYCSAHHTLIAVAELPSIEKRANDEGTNTPGNNLTRNFMLQFTGAQALTGLTVAADVWQLDFTVRLKGIDERERLSNRDIYGRDAFLGDGWLLVNAAGSYHFEPGTGYVEGIRAALASQLPAVPAPLPCDVHLDVCLAPQGSDVVTLVTPRFVAQGAGLPDYAEGAPFHTPHYCAQVAHVAADGTVTDMRTKNVLLVDQPLDDHNTDPEAHPYLRAAIASIVIPDPATIDEIYIDAGSMTPCVTDGAVLTIVEDSANHHTRNVMSFQGSTANTKAAFNFRLPANWDRGTVKAKVLWTPANGASADNQVRFQLAGVAVSDDDALDVPLGALVNIDDTVLAVGDLHISPASSALTIAGNPAVGDYIRMELSRVYNYGSPGLGVAAQVLGIVVQYGVTGNIQAW